MKLVYHQTLFLDTTGITYGSGIYEIYSSSTYDNGNANKDKLVNYNTDLNFSELFLFGKEIMGNTITSKIYTISNAVQNIVQNVPIVSKHRCISLRRSVPISINGTAYYRYDLHLSPYTTLGSTFIGAITEYYRIYRIHMCLGTKHYTMLSHRQPDVIISHIFQSYKQNDGLYGAKAGLNMAKI